MRILRVVCSSSMQCTFVQKTHLYHFSTKLLKHKSGESRSVIGAKSELVRTVLENTIVRLFLSGAKRRNSVLRLSIDPWRRRPYDVSFNVYIERFSLRYTASRIYLENDNSGPLPTG